MKNIGKPCAGKPHARFDEGGLAKAAMVGYLGAVRRKGRKRTSPTYSGSNQFSTLPRRPLYARKSDDVLSYIKTAEKMLAATEK